jgi:hypothetical protein
LIARQVGRMTTFSASSSYPSTWLTPRGPGCIIYREMSLIAQKIVGRSSPAISMARTCTRATLSHPGSEKIKPKALYVYPGCSNRTYGNNMVNRYNISLNYKLKSYKMTLASERRLQSKAMAESKCGWSLHRCN